MSLYLLERKEFLKLESRKEFLKLESAYSDGLNKQRVHILVDRKSTI